MIIHRRNTTNSSAFTLIELLIVVAIIGILAAIAVPNFMSARLRAKVARAYSDIKALAMANEMYNLDNNGYPPESEHNPYQRPRISQGLFFLTSPIAYIAAIPNAIFVPKEWLTHEETTPYVYETGVTKGPGHNKYVAYAIFTVGPDGIEDIYSENPFVSKGYGDINTTYATSNGLTSPGDIYWYGGNCSAVVKSLWIDGHVLNGVCPPNFRN